MKQYFTSRRIAKDTWIISGDGCDCYLLEGDNEAIMIDSGMSDKNIKEYAQKLTDVSINRVVNTHSHFDHTAGNGHFDIVMVTKGISRSAKNTFGANPNNFPLDYEFTYIDDGDILDIGNRPLMVIELNCHSPNDIAILDSSRRFLFCGDEIDSGSSLLLPGYAEEMNQIHASAAGAVETHLNAMKKLKSYYCDFDYLCPSHNGSPIDKVYIDWFIELDEMIINGYIGSTDCEGYSYSADMMHFPFPNAGYLRASYKGASLVYNKDLIFEKDREKANNLPVATPLHILSSRYILN